MDLTGIGKYADAAKWIAGIAVFVGYTVFVAWLWGGHVSAKYDKEIAKQKIAAAKQVAEGWAAAAANENHNAWLQSEAEMKHVELEKIRTEKETFVRIALANAGGLRDPGRRESDQQAAPTTAAGTGVVVCPADDRRLSGELTEFLLAQFGKTNTLRDTVKECYDYANKIKKFREGLEAENEKLRLQIAQ